MQHGESPHVTLKERFQEDGVGMRWLRTAATTLTSITAALLVIWGGALWLVEPRLHEWANDLVQKSTEDVRQRLSTTDNAVSRIESAIQALERSVLSIQQVSAESSSPAWRFDTVETSISDGAVGDLVQIRSAGFKLRECGVPVIDVYFVNGGGVFHRFTDPSILSDIGRGVSLPTDPSRLQIITYTARIPNQDGVSPGRGLGYISITYPDSCPNVAPSVAGPLQFRILPQS